MPLAIPTGAASFIIDEKSDKAFEVLKQQQKIIGLTDLATSLNQTSTTISQRMFNITQALQGATTDSSKQQLTFQQQLLEIQAKMNDTKLDNVHKQDTQAQQVLAVLNSQVQALEKMLEAQAEIAKKDANSEGGSWKAFG